MSLKIFLMFKLVDALEYHTNRIVLREYVLESSNKSTNFTHLNILSYWNYAVTKLFLLSVFDKVLEYSIIIKDINEKK